MRDRSAPIRTRWRIAVRAAVVGAVLAADVGRAGAQEMARFTADSVVAVDLFRGENVSDRPQMVIDASAGVRLGSRWQLLVRPWFRKARPALPGGIAPAWDFQLYQAGLRYERPGPIATRLEIGQMPSPIGLGNLEWRANVNPTIVPHLTYVVPMPAFDPASPRVTPVAQNYPVGAIATVSTLHWDARGGVVNAAPVRGWAIGADNNPHQTPVAVGGAGITPIIGLRVGMSLAHGEYATDREVLRAAAGRTMTLVGGEAEYSFRYTRLAAELVRTSFATSGSPAAAYEYFVQGTHTLTPRLFAAARHESALAPASVSVAKAARMKMYEATVGYRITPDVTARTSYYVRRTYTAASFDHQVGISLVWAARWR